MEQTQILNDLLDKTKTEKYRIYYEYLIEQNKLLNLTAIIEEKDVYLKHFYDSMVISKYLNFKDKKVLDIGAGAGFPSIPIYLSEESMSLTIIDGLKKRIDFLQRLSDKLDIKIKLIHGRAEELGVFNHYDIVLARAVAKLNILLEMALPVLRINGYFVAYKSIHYQEELEEAKHAIDVLGGKIEKVIEYDIMEELKHVYIIIKKVKKSGKGYPRHFSKIKKSPL